MINIREAVAAVTEYLKFIGPLVPSGDFQLEEFEFDSDLQVWLLTFSFENAFNAQRIYRIFRVDQAGNVLSMKIRQPESELF